MLSRSHCLALTLFGSLVGACQDAPRHHDEDAQPPDAEAAEDDADLDPEPEPDASEPDELDAAWDAEVDAASVVDASPPDAGSDANVRPGVIPGVGFADALRVETQGEPLLVNERSAEQVDYFVFHAEADAFYELTTDRSLYSPDNVIRLYDSARRLVATNDDGPLWPGDNIDSRLVVHTALAGDYFLRVEDPYTPPEFFGSDFALLYYYLRVRRVSEDTPGFARVRPDGCGNPTFRHDDRTGFDYITLLGMFSAEGASCTFTGLADRALIAHVPVGGAEHDGSSFSGGRVRVANGDGGVVAEIDRARGQENIHPPLAAGPFAVRVDPSGSAPLGDNPYYSLDLIQLPENPAERADSANGVLAGAEAVMLSGSRGRRGLVLSRLPAGDVDYYRFDLAEKDLVRLSCEAESGGSGVRGLSAEVRDANDQKLASGVETALENLLTEPVEVPSAGTYYLRLASTGAESPAVEPWARCAVLINR